MEAKYFDWSCFDKFIGRKMEITNKDTDTTYIYNAFNYDAHTYNQLILMDSTMENCKTFIHLDNIERIVSVSEDVYDDVLYIKTTHYDFYINCIEEKPELPKCRKCGREINVPEETIWSIHGMANYGSRYDDWEDNMAVNSMIFCDDCVYGWLGEVE